MQIGDTSSEEGDEEAGAEQQQRKAGDVVEAAASEGGASDASTSTPHISGAGTGAAAQRFVSSESEEAESTSGTAASMPLKRAAPDVGLEEEWREEGWEPAPSPTAPPLPSGVAARLGDWGAYDAPAGADPPATTDDVWNTYQPLLCGSGSDSGSSGSDSWDGDWRGGRRGLGRTRRSSEATTPDLAVEAAADPLQAVLDGQGEARRLLELALGQPLLHDPRRVDPPASYPPALQVSRRCAALPGGVAQRLCRCSLRRLPSRRPAAANC